MKLLVLNTWGGKLYEPLMNFIKSYNNEVDIFCFQELWDSKKNLVVDGIKTNLLSDISKILKDYSFYYSPVFKNFLSKQKVNYDLSHGLGIFVKKQIHILSKGNVFVYKEFDQKELLFHNRAYLDHPRNIQYVKIRKHDEPFLILNFHGYFIPALKKDTPQRIAQSKKIVKFLNSKKLPKILCGDFNLDPDTKSIKMIEGNMINLIKKYNIKSTRSKFYERDNKFADYILVSKDIKVKDFKVLSDEVSDHLPLLLEFEP